jgi:hypothetical protein
MSTKIASLFAEIGADTSKLESGLKTTKDGLGGAKNAFEQLTGSSLSAVGAFTAVTGALKFSLDAAIESEKADANLNATLKSTQGAAGMTAEEIKRLSASLADMAGQDDEAVQNANSMLLTFTKIGKEVFPQASEAIVNMAAKFGGLEAATMQVGKALNDPIAGVGALRKVGVALTEQQEDSIRSFMAVNDIAGAQKIILGELETEFGGLGAAMGQTLEGKVKRLETTLGNLGETIGMQLLPVLSDAADALNLLLTVNDKVTDTFFLHNGEMKRTAKSYAEYRTEMERAAKVAGLQVSATGEVTRSVVGANGAVTQMSVGLNLAADYYKDLADEGTRAAAAQRGFTRDTQAAGNAVSATTPDLLDLALALQAEEGAYQDTASAARPYTTAIQDQAAAFDNLKVAMNITASTEAFNEAQADLQGKINGTKQLIDDMSKMKYRTPEQEAQLNDLRQQLRDQEGGLRDLQDTHKKATDSMIYNMLLTKAASDGLTEVELENLLKVGNAMGLVDDKTYDMAKALNSIDLSSGRIELDSILGVLKGIMGQPNSKNIHITTRYTSIFDTRDQQPNDPEAPIPGEAGWGNGGNPGGDGLAGMQSDTPISINGVRRAGQAGQTVNYFTTNVIGWQGDGASLAAEIARRAEVQRIMG